MKLDHDQEKMFQPLTRAKVKWEKTPNQPETD